MKKYLITFLIGVVVALTGFFLFVRGRTGQIVSLGPDRAAVIKQIQSLNKLETASYSIDKIIEAGHENSTVTDFFFGDKILLVAHGNVTAGIDLSKIANKDIEGKGKEIRIKLPAAEILTTALDNSKTRVFDRKQGLLTKGDLNLEAEARGLAEQAISQAACEGGILDSANAQAQKQLELLFKAAGFDVVIVETSPSTCPSK